MGSYAKVIVLSIAALYFSFIVTSCSTLDAQGRTENAEVVKNLYEEKEYFHFRDEFLKKRKYLSEEDRLHFEALLYGLQNKTDRSNRAIEALLGARPNARDPALTAKLYVVKRWNAIKAGRYEKAFEITRYLLENLRQHLGKEEISSMENDIKIFESIANVPAPGAIKSVDTTFKLKRDKANLQTIQMDLSSGSIDLVLDTGANFSVLQQSVAEELGLTVKPADFLVGSSTGARIPGRIAVAERLQLGSITLKNTVFLVFEDEALKFLQADYEIKGILGFPVIYALEELRFNHARDELFVPAVAGNYNNENLMYEGLMPLVRVNYKGDALTFCLDSGAKNTDLYPPFFRRYERDIVGTHLKASIQIGGVGGLVQVNGFTDVAAKFDIGSGERELTGMRVLVDETNEHSKVFSGNLGQDYLDLFDETIISFKCSALVLRAK